MTQLLIQLLRVLLSQANVKRMSSNLGMFDFDAPELKRNSSRASMNGSARDIGSVAGSHGRGSQRVSFQQDHAQTASRQRAPPTPREYEMSSTVSRGSGGAVVGNPVYGRPNHGLFQPATPSSPYDPPQFTNSLNSPSHIGDGGYSSVGGGGYPPYTIDSEGDNNSMVTYTMPDGSYVPPPPAYADPYETSTGIQAVRHRLIVIADSAF